MNVETVEPLRAPFPWFGGKRRVAEEVWTSFGEVSSYNEPFFGSGAVLLGRPHAPRIETVNDLDCYLANFWRALQADPEAVAHYADGPVNEADLHARHRWLVTHGRRLALRCTRDPHYFNAKVAGWWVWGQCLWIGSGWCAQTDKRNQHPSEQAKKFRDGPVGLLRQLDQKRFRGDGDSGVHKKRFAGVGNGQGTGVHRRWQGGGQAGGSGVHAPTLHQTKPDMSGDSGASGRGIFAPRYSEGLYTYLETLATRMRRVRVCCGDWRRVLTPSVTSYIGVTGVFLDPPYSHELRERCYAEDHDISVEVRIWAIEHGDDPSFRIALCGYEEEHKATMPASWTMVAWKAHGGYARTERGKANRERERIWFSPHCLQAEQGTLFTAEETHQ